MKNCVLVIRAQKTICIQLLCNYIITTMQLSPWKYEKLINKKCHFKKLVNYIIIVSELKISLLYGNLYTLYIHP